MNFGVAFSCCSFKAEPNILKSGVDRKFTSFHFNETIFVESPKINGRRVFVFGIGSPVMVALSTVVSPEIILPSRESFGPVLPLDEAAHENAQRH
jgi:hypothetical protein